MGYEGSSGRCFFLQGTTSADGLYIVCMFKLWKRNALRCTSQDQRTGEHGAAAPSRFFPDWFIRV